MKFKSKFGAWFLGISLFALISLFAVGVSVLFNSSVLLGVVLILATLALAWIMFDIKYFIYDKNFVVKIAFVRFVVKVESIVEVKEAKGVPFLFSRAREGIKLRVLLNNGKTRFIFISPVNESSFCGKIKEKSGNIIIDEDSTN